MAKNVESSKELIEAWSGEYGRQVSLSEVQEINRNLSDFFALLLSWDQDFKSKGLLDEFGNIRNPARSR